MLEHGDNLGNAGALTVGDIQWMTAGRGITMCAPSRNSEYYQRFLQQAEDANPRARS